MLLDVKKNEILAMVSKPSVQVKGESLYKTTLENQMLTPHFPGSVFKTIIAAAATLPEDVERLSRTYMNAPTHIEIKAAGITTDKMNIPF